MPQPAKYTLPDISKVQCDIGFNITKARKRFGWNQKDLAEKIGLSQGLLSHYETGKRTIPLDVLIQISITLNVSVDTLLGLNKKDSHDDYMPSRKILLRLQKIENLPPNEQKVLLKNIDMFLKAAESIC